MYDLIPKYIPSENVEQLAEGVLGAIAATFAEDKRAGLSSQTLDEGRRRAALCIKVIDRLVNERWGLKRIVDHLPKYLRCELDRVDWKPDTRVLWTRGGDR